MSKIPVTYNAPKGDEKVVETHGQTFYHGQSVDLDEREHEAFLKKARGNRHFLVGDQTADDPFKGHGKTSKTVDLKGAIAGARDRDFEADRRANLEPRDDLGTGDHADAGDSSEGKSLDDMNIDELRAEAEKRNIPHQGVGKKELRAALKG